MLHCALLIAVHAQTPIMALCASVHTNPRTSSSTIRTGLSRPRRLQVLPRRPRQPRLRRGPSQSRDPFPEPPSMAVNNQDAASCPSCSKLVFLHVGRRGTGNVSSRNSAPNRQAREVHRVVNTAKEGAGHVAGGIQSRYRKVAIVEDPVAVIHHQAA